MKTEKNLLNQLSNVDSFDDYMDEQIGMAPLTSQKGTPTSVRPQAGNPLFTAQFDLELRTEYFTVTAGVYMPILPAALDAPLRNDLPFFLFGTNDFASGYAFLKGQYPINQNWRYGSPFIYTGQDTDLALDANAKAVLLDGDMVIPFLSDNPGGGTTTVCLHIVRSGNVGYGTIIDSLNSDRFILNGIRYVIDDATQIAQFSRQIGTHDLSLFGKAKNDTISPNSYKSPEQFQNGIIDIPVEYGVDKHKSLAIQNIYTNLTQSLSIFVVALAKVEA